MMTAACDIKPPLEDLMIRCNMVVLSDALLTGHKNNID